MQIDYYFDTPNSIDSITITASNGTQILNAPFVADTIPVFVIEFGNMTVSSFIQ